MNQAQAAQIAKAGRRLKQEAHGHMRLSRQHRDRAKTLYHELNELNAACGQLGIQLDLQPPITNPQGGTSGNSNSTEDAR